MHIEGDLPSAFPYGMPFAANRRFASTWLRRWLVSPVMSAVVVVAVLFSVLMLSTLEVGARRTTTLQQQLASMTDVRLNILQMQQDVQKAMTAQWAYLGTRQPEHLQDMTRSLHQALAHVALVQGGLTSRPALYEQAEQLGKALQTNLDEMSELAQPARGNQAQAEAIRARTGLALAYILRLNQALGPVSDQVQADVSMALSKQRINMAVLVGLDLLLTCALVIRALRYFHDHEAQRRSLLSQTVQLEAAMQVRTKELYELSTQLQYQSEKEKSSLARELHDEMGALLTSAKLELNWIQRHHSVDDQQLLARLTQLSNVLDQITHIKRRVIENLHPSLLTHLGLGPALTWHVQQTCDNAGLIHQVQMPDEDVLIDKDISLVLYRVVQEALNNTLRHAQANKVLVALAVTPSGYELKVQDDGIGIVSTRPEQLSHGIAGMRHRVTAMGGCFTVSSQPGQGTCIEVHIPRAAVGTSSKPTIQDRCVA